MLVTNNQPSFLKDIPAKYDFIKEPVKKLVSAGPGTGKQKLVQLAIGTGIGIVGSYISNFIKDASNPFDDGEIQVGTPVKTNKLRKKYRGRSQPRGSCRYGYNNHTGKCRKRLYRRGYSGSYRR